MITTRPRYSPTAPSNSNNTRIANTEWVKSILADYALLDSGSMSIRVGGVILYDSVGDGDYFLSADNTGLDFNGNKVITTAGGQTINGDLTATGLVRSATGVICGSPTTLDAGKLFQVEGNFGTGGGQGIKLRNTNASGYTEIVFNNNNNRADGCALVGFGGSTAGGTPNDLYLSSRVGGIQFYTNNSYRARFLSNGRFLINTSTDDGGSLLQVNGTAAVTTLAIGGGTGPLLHNNGGTIEARTNDNLAMSPFSCSNLTASGTVTNQGIRLLQAAGGSLRGVLNCPSWDISYVALRNGTLAETAANTGFYQSSQGDSALNAASGRGASISIANVSVVGVTSGAVAITGTLSYTGSLVFPELVTNGGFDTDTAWSKGAGWTISGGTAVATGVVSFADIQQNLPAVELGRTYIISFSVSVTSGSVQVFLGSSGSGPGAVTTINGSGTYSFLHHKSPADTIRTILFRGGAAFTGTIDNVSVRRAF